MDLHFNADEQELAASVAMTHLAKCYDALSAGHGDSLAALKLHSRLFAAQLVALEGVFGDNGSWRIKPKLHQFLEICSDGSWPSANWNYRDEDFGGNMSRMSRRRGGLLSTLSTSRALITRFRIKVPFPHILPVEP